MKILENYLKDSAYKQVDSDFFKNGGWEIVDLKIPKAIEHLLQDYTRQKQINEEHQKINGELREKVKELENENISKQKAYDDCYCEYKHYKQFESISKQKIKDKIEELKETLKDYNEYSKLNLLEKVNVDLIDARIEVLQELLEGERK